jgi:hypothetical protein
MRTIWSDETSRHKSSLRPEVWEPDQSSGVRRGSYTPAYHEGNRIGGSLRWMLKVSIHVS